MAVMEHAKVIRAYHIRILIREHDLRLMKANQIARALDPAEIPQGWPIGELNWLTRKRNR